VVAVGNLDKVWLEIPEDISEKAFQQAFRSMFEAEWTEVLDTADRSFPYNASNDAFFSIRKIHPVEDLTLNELLEKEGARQPANIIVS